MKNKRNHYSAKHTEKFTGLRNIQGAPETAFDMVNKYGTYEIQPTCQNDNDFPQIAQGTAKKKKGNKQ